MEILREKAEYQVSLPEKNARARKVLRRETESLRSLGVIEDALVEFNLSRNEIRVYIHLARSGTCKAREISDALSLHRTETYRILRDLGKRGLISSVLEKPLKFTAAPFEEAFSSLMKAKKLKIELLERKKKNLIDIWYSIPHPKVEPENKEVFQILEGEEQIIIKANEILDKTREAIYVLAPDSELLRLYHSGFTDSLEGFSRKKGKVRLLTNRSPKSCFIAEKMKLTDIRYLFPYVESLPSFIISDHEQLLFSIKNGNDVNDSGRRKRKVSSLWTNYDAFIRTLKTLFLVLWDTKTL